MGVGGVTGSVDGTPAAILAARWGVAELHWRESVSSTLDLLDELARRGAPDGTLVIADRQTRGRGRHGRAWHSPAGGVWLGYLARPGGATGVMALRVGLAVADALGSIGAQVSLKWPNDIMLYDKKLGGVLCEASWRGQSVEWMAIGIGLNVRGGLSEDLASRAMALAESLPDASRLAVLDQLVPRLVALSHAESLSAQELTAFRTRDWLTGRRITEPCVGEVIGIDSDGALLVRAATGTTRLVGGTIVTD